MTTTKTATRNRHRLAVAGVVPVLAILTTTTSAAAQPLLHEHYSVSDSFIWEDYCHVDGRPELTVQYNSQFDGSIVVNSRGPDGLAYGVDNLRYTNVRTNLVNGKTVTTDGVEKRRDQTVIDNGDGTLTIREAGSFELRSYDSSGHILDHAAGVAVFEFLIDDNGTPTDPFDDGEPEFVRVAREFVGQPGIDNWCEVVHDALE